MVVFREFQESMTNSSLNEEKRRLRYLSESEARTTFAGNFSTKERRNFFDFNEGQREIPCGFMKEFRLSHSDRMAMENCRGLVIVSAIFNNHDKIRQPKGLGAKTLRTACFFMFVDNKTIEGLIAHNIMLNKTEKTKIGVWEMVKVLEKLPYQNPAMNGVIPKHLVHRLFPNAYYSIWVDAKIQLTADPLLLLHSLLISKDADMAISNHPFNVHTMEEAMATARWKKWGDIQSLREQMEAYCENGLRPWSREKLPYTTDVPDTALILRKHGIKSNLFSCLLFNELEAFNPRDQLSFAYVRDLMKPKIKINMFEAEIFEQIAMEYRHNIKKGGGASSSYAVNPKMASTKDISGSKCEKYLEGMWADSHD
ncbi:unnamed protein product [Victoria cruziana]